MTTKTYLPDLSWKDKPDDEDYNNAFQYLTLLTSLNKANEIVDRLIESDNTLVRTVEDIIRASGVNYPRYDILTTQRLENAISGKENLSPILLVQAKDSSRVHVVSGYDALAALWHLQKGTRVPCILTAWESE